MSTSTLYLAHRKPRRHRWYHIFRLFLLTISLIIISTGAVIYSLGYEPNLEARTFQQTGSIVIDGISSIGGLSITLNGELEGRQLPFRRTHLLPGIYALSIHRDGYQNWSQTVHVMESQVISFHNIVLVKTSPEPVTAQSDWLQDWIPNISPRLSASDNEIWLDGAFLTRFSEQILSVSFFPGEREIVYQTPTQLGLIDPKSRVVQKLVSVETSGQLKFIFRNGGQVLVYEDPSSHQVKAVKLYD